MDTADAVVTRSKMVAWCLYGRDIRARNPTMQSDGPTGLSSGDSGGQIIDDISSSISDHPVLPVDDRRPLSPVEPSMVSRQSRQDTSDEETSLDGGNAVIERTNPSRGAMSGGPEIWISGSNFPTAKTPLYARFGDNFARVVGVPLPSLGQYMTTPRLFKTLPALVPSAAS